MQIELTENGAAINCSVQDGILLYEGLAAHIGGICALCSWTIKDFAQVSKQMDTNQLNSILQKMQIEPGTKVTDSVLAAGQEYLIKNELEPAQKMIKQLEVLLPQKQAYEADLDINLD